MGVKPVHHSAIVVLGLSSVISLTAGQPPMFQPATDQAAVATLGSSDDASRYHEQNDSGDGSADQGVESCLFEDGVVVGPVCVELDDVGENIAT